MADTRIHVFLFETGGEHRMPPAAGIGRILKRSDVLRPISNSSFRVVDWTPGADPEIGRLQVIEERYVTVRLWLPRDTACDWVERMLCDRSNLDRVHLPATLKRELKQHPHLRASDVDGWSFDGQRTATSEDDLAGLPHLLSAHRRVTETVERHLGCDDYARNPKPSLADAIPVLIRFSDKLTSSVFETFAETLTDRGCTLPNPLRIRGIVERTPSSFKATAIDEHFWVPYQMSATRDQVTLIVPRHTCGSMIHRWVAHTQERLDPNAQAWVRGVPYARIASDAIRERPGYAEPVKVRQPIIAGLPLQDSTMPSSTGCFE